MELNKISDEPSEAIFTTKELHCLARLLQGAFYKGEPFYCCGSGHCLYSQECVNTRSGKTALEDYFYFRLRDKLEKLTGVYLGIAVGDEYVDKRMLENSYVSVTGRYVSEPRSQQDCSTEGNKISGAKAVTRKSGGFFVPERSTQ